LLLGLAGPLRNYFPIFAKVHPKLNIPHVSLLVLGALAFVFSLLFKMREIITAIVVMRILVQFIAQSIGLIQFRIRFKQEQFPYKMYWFPIPPILGILVWLFVFFSVEWAYTFGAFSIITLGSILFLIQSKKQQKWPYEISI
jgi:amino acid transporter